MNNIHDYINLLIKEKLDPSGIALDATVGNGFDSCKILKHLNESGFLYGIDIQASAVSNSLEKIEKLAPQAKYHIFQGDHSQLEQLLPSDLRLSFVIFNLGYLPGSDKSQITKAKSTIPAIKWVVDHLAVSGLIIIAAYLGHEGGWEEYESIKCLLQNLPQKSYNSSEIKFINQRNQPPRLFVVERRFDFDENSNTSRAN